MRTPTSPLIRVSAVAVLLASVALAGPAEIYGRPLRGLTLVRVAEILRDPKALGARAFRIGGRCERTSEGALTVRDAEAVIALEAIGFAVPENAVGAQIAAEGRIGAEDEKDTVRFLADGVEVAR
jgi:hypothetical protein